MMSIPADEVHLWYALPDAVRDAGQVERCRKWLSPGELARRERFRFEKDRHLFLVAHALVRAVLSRYAGVAPQEWRFVAAAQGKPCIAGPAGAPPLRFNLSHTRGLVAVAVAREREVGVDVESLHRRRDDGLVRSVLADAEWDQWRQRPPEERPGVFLEFWTLKEAWLKVRGTGLSGELQDVAFELLPDVAPRVTFAASLGDDPDRWQFWQDFRHPQHRAAVAARRQPAESLRLKVIPSDPLAE